MGRNVTPSKNEVTASPHQGFPHFHHEKGTCLCLRGCCFGPGGCRCRGCSGVGHHGCPGAIALKARAKRESQEAA